MESVIESDAKPYGFETDVNGASAVPLNCSSRKSEDFRDNSQPPIWRKKITLSSLRTLFFCKIGRRIKQNIMKE